jgi:hypothetical protein
MFHSLQVAISRRTSMQYILQGTTCLDIKFGSFGWWLTHTLAWAPCHHGPSHPRLSLVRGKGHTLLITRKDRRVGYSASYAHIYRLTLLGLTPTTAKQMPIYSLVRVSWSILTRIGSQRRHQDSDLREAPSIRNPAIV